MMNDTKTVDIFLHLILREGKLVSRGGEQKGKIIYNMFEDSSMIVYLDTMLWQLMKNWAPLCPSSPHVWLLTNTYHTPFQVLSMQESFLVYFNGDFTHIPDM